MTHRFVTSCAHALGCDINEMVATPLRRDLTNRYFILALAPKIEVVSDVLEMFGHESKQTFLADSAISCASSYYQGIPCYFIQHSQIEYVYLDSIDFDAVLSTDNAKARQAKIKELGGQFCELLNERAPSNEKAFYLAAKEFHGKNLPVLHQYRIPLSTLAQSQRDHASAFSLFDRKHYAFGGRANHTPNPEGFLCRQW
jgi:hypothetical protein